MIIPILFIFYILFALYYLFTFYAIDSFQIFLTISTFLFATFTGFFISRQGKRYSKIREAITSFDGEMSGLYRQFGHLGKIHQKSVKKIIKKHYDLIIKNKAWDYHFVNKSTTLTDINNLVNKTTKNKNLKSLMNLALREILTSLQRLQVIRKKMVALHKERVPVFNWIIISFISLILFITLSAIPSQNLIIESVLKAAFSTSIISVLILLYRLDKLKLFSKITGEESAQDVLNIFSGKK
jgi:hypothetical protein